MEKVDGFTVSVRLALGRDVAWMAKVEHATGGDWNEKEFAHLLTKRNVVCYVATTRHKDSAEEQVCGFVILEISKYEASAINMASTYPPARQLLIDKAFKCAKRHHRNLVWEEP